MSFPWEVKAMMVCVPGMSLITVQTFLERKYVNSLSASTLLSLAYSNI